MNFREYARAAKAHDRGVAKRQIMLSLGVFLPLLALLILYLARPDYLLGSVATIAQNTGFPTVARKLGDHSRHLEAERLVRQRFDDNPVWIELPDSHTAVFARAYLDCFDAGASISLFPAGKSRFKACVPEGLSSRFAVERLDAINAPPK